MFQAIVYDAVGTLIHVKPSVAELYVQVGRRFGSGLDAPEVRRRFPVAFARQEHIDCEAGWRTNEMRERGRWRDIVAEVLDDVTEAEACFETLWDVFSRPDAWTHDADVAGVLATIRQRGILQAVASNFDGRLHGLLDAMPALAGLAPIVISSEVGWRKPAPEFFEALQQALQLPPERIFFVGDDRANDFDAARSAGMHAVLLDPTSRHDDVADRLERLRDVLRI
jgi:putative hydrolase of the HAD superfamily